MGVACSQLGDKFMIDHIAVIGPHIVSTNRHQTARPWKWPPSILSIKDTMTNIVSKLKKCELIGMPTVSCRVSDVLVSLDRLFAN